MLRPVKEAQDEYADWNWEKRMKKARTVVAKAKGDPLEPRDVVVGIVRNGRARAYPFPRMKAQNPVIDQLGGEPIVVVVGDDRKSVRVFKAEVDGRSLSLLRKAEPGPIRLVDAETGSEWDFTGAAVAGPLDGRPAREGLRPEGVLVRLEDLQPLDQRLHPRPPDRQLARGPIPGPAIDGLPGNDPRTPESLRFRTARGRSPK